MATDYLELNKEVLEELKESDPVKYRSLKLYLECQNIYAETDDWNQAAAHWNAWAEARLAERKKLVESGEWQAEAAGPPIGLLGRNQPTRDWMDTAKVDLSRMRFLLENDKVNAERKKEDEDETFHQVLVKKLLFTNFMFPYDAEFLRVRIECDVDFSYALFNGLARFSFATFRGRMGFAETMFCDYACFNMATFGGTADFVEAMFGGEADFNKAVFGYADFQWATFKGETRFWDAKFGGVAEFTATTFNDQASFEAATFSDEVSFQASTFKEVVSFHQVRFERPVDFGLARFRRTADFSSIHSAVGFSLHCARFKVAPDFTKSAFLAPPLLDMLQVAEQLTDKRDWWLFRFRCIDPEKSVLRISWNFRTLAEMAHDARDWLNEMEFFAQEIRARRFEEDFPIGKNMGRFWFGLIYEKASDFGRSFARPLALWAVTTALFAGLYAALASEWGAWNGWDALYLSVRHGLVVGGLVRTGHMQQVIEAMFGEMGSGLALLMMGQTVISAFFLFLFFLAVRNHFRIR